MKEKLEKEEKKEEFKKVEESHKKLEKDIKKSIRILPSKDMEGFFVSKFIKK